MKWFFLLSLLAVAFVQALPDAETKNGEDLVLRPRNKRDLASARRKAEEGTHLRKKRDAEESEKPEKEEKSGRMNLDVDIDIKGLVGKAVIDIDVDAGNGEGKKSEGPESEDGGEKQAAPKSGQDPCECVASMKEQALKLDGALDSLINALESLEEVALANKDPGLPRVSSTALTVVESLKNDVNQTVKAIGKYWYYYCRYVYYYYYGWVYRCTWYYIYRHRRDANGEMDLTETTGMEPAVPVGMGPGGPQGMEPAGQPGMEPAGPPGMEPAGPPGMEPAGQPGMGPGEPQDMEPMPTGETGNPLCTASDMFGILEGITKETEKALTLTEQAAKDSAISADAVSDFGEIIDVLEEQKKKNEEVMKELEGLPCKD